MKFFRLFMAAMLIAAVAVTVVGCKKTDTSSTTKTEKVETKTPADNK